MDRQMIQTFTRRYKISAIMKIRAAGYLLEEGGVSYCAVDIQRTPAVGPAYFETVIVGDPVEWVNSKYPGANITSLDLEHSV